MEVKSSDNLPDTIIVSVFGRGNWLATELAARGWKVTLVDISDSLGNWDAEDAEGPFGLFEAPDLSASQLERYKEIGETVGLPQGFVLWPRSGPIEFRSELTTFQLNRLRKDGSPEIVQKYLQQAALPSRETEKDNRAIRRLDFEQAWLAHFAHHFASATTRENHRAIESGTPSPLFSPFRIRNVSKEGYVRALKACESAKVTVRANAGVRDARVSGKIIDAIEIGDERSGVARAKSFVWMLSSIETEHLGAHLCEVLFNSEAVEPAWFWARYQFTIGGRFNTEMIPSYAVLIEDLLLPWSHENLLILRKGNAKSKSNDVWVRIPTRCRFDKSYLESKGQAIAEVLKIRLPQSEPAVVALPAEGRLDGAKAGPVRHPIFTASGLRDFHPLKAPNLFFDGPEMGESLDALGQCRRQIRLLDRLEKLKAQWDEAARRAAQAAARSASP